MNYKEDWDKGISFNTYFEESLKKHSELESSENEHDKEYLNYYKLGISRTNRLLKTFESTENQLNKKNNLKEKFNFLIISEAWCGDASQVVPAMHSFFSEESIRIVYRDENEDLMNQFLTNGSKSIPKVLILDENYNLKTSWGPRAKNASKLLEEHKTKESGFDKGLFYKDLQSYYAKNKGEEVIDEILNLL